jgi:C terminal of Calcineurin-like phosphoesterase/Calcineurin-like phosphoesterase
VQRMGVPFYQVIGNHDLDYASRTAEGASATYRQHFGPTAYSMDIGAIHYIVLDNVFWHGDGYIGYIDATQLNWMAADLATVERGRTVVLMQHIPALSSYDARSSNARKPSAGNSTMNRQALYRLLEPYRAYIVSGHQHELEHVHEGGPTHVVSGAVCGAWWSGPICNDGTPNGYLVLHGDDAAVTWRYQSTGFSATHQMRVYGRGADPTAPGDVIANVWAWDESWRVSTPTLRPLRRRWSSRPSTVAGTRTGSAMPSPKS